MISFVAGCGWFFMAKGSFWDREENLPAVISGIRRLYLANAQLTQVFNYFAMLYVVWHNG
jgi:hypothetical protein